MVSSDAAARLSIMLGWGHRLDRSLHTSRLVEPAAPFLAEPAAVPAATTEAWGQKLTVAVRGIDFCAMQQILDAFPVL